MNKGSMLEERPVDLLETQADEAFCLNPEHLPLEHGKGFDKFTRTRFMDRTGIKALGHDVLVHD